MAVRPAAKPAALLQKPPLLAPRRLLILPLLQPTPIKPDPALGYDPQLGELTAAVATGMKQAQLTIGPELSAGRETRVVLTLPAGLLDSIQGKAADLGLDRAARNASVAVQLSGQGYAVTPNQEQSVRLKPGEASVFSWQVKPAGTSGGVLTADMTGALDGSRTFALGALTAQIPAAAAASINAPAPIPARANPSRPALLDLSKLNLGALRLPDLGKMTLPHLSRFHLHDLAIPGHKAIDIPGLGPIGSEKLVTVGILAAILLLLIAIARNASARRAKAERRRRFHTFEATSFGDEPGHEASAPGH